jgi:hypothetical protein
MGPRVAAPPAAPVAVSSQGNAKPPAVKAPTRCKKRRRVNAGSASNQAAAAVQQRR